MLIHIIANQSQVNIYIIAFFLIWACRRGGEKCIHNCARHPMPPRRRAFRSNDFGLEPTTVPRDAKRQAEPPSRRERIPAKIISTAIPHAGSSNPTLIPRRATHTLVSTFSRAAIFPRTVPFLPSFRPYRGYVTSYKPSPFRTGKAHCFVARDPRGAIVVSAPSCPTPSLLRRLYGVNKILSLRDCSRKSIVYYFYRALAPDGTAQVKLLIIGINFLIS